MPKKREAGARELVATQGGLDDGLLRALAGKPSLRELDALAASGARVGEMGLIVAARGGSAQSTRWVLSQLPKPEGRDGVKFRSIALWHALSSSATSPAKASALIEALGLPRALKGAERDEAWAVLGLAAAGDSEGALVQLLSAMEPLDEKKRPSFGCDFFESAAISGARRVRVILEHPVHGPSISARRKGRAIEAAMSSGRSEEEALETLQALFDQAELGVGGDATAVLTTAGVYGQESSVRWMMSHPDGRALKASKKAARRLREASSEAMADLIDALRLAKEEQAQLQLATEATEATEGEEPTEAGNGQPGRRLRV